MCALPNIGRPSLQTQRSRTDFSFYYDADRLISFCPCNREYKHTQILRLNPNRVIVWVSQEDMLQNSCTRPRTNRTVFVCEALVGRMRARHSAAGIRVTPSCSVSEVLKTSQSTFLPETDARNNSWAKTEEFRVLLLGEQVSSEQKNQKEPACVRVQWLNVRHKKTFFGLTLSQITNEGTHFWLSKMTYWLKVIAQTLSTLYSHNRRVLIATDQIILGNPHNLHPRRNRPLI